MRSIFVFAAMLIFSVIWPYIKLLMMVQLVSTALSGCDEALRYVWAAPVNPKARGPILLFLDAWPVGWHSFGR